MSDTATQGPRRRGQPLVSTLAVLAGWVVVRALTLELDPQPVPAATRVAGPPPGTTLAERPSLPKPRAFADPPPGISVPRPDFAQHASFAMAERLFAAPAPWLAPPKPRTGLVAHAESVLLPAPELSLAGRVVPAASSAFIQPATTRGDTLQPSRPLTAPAALRRWSGDGWVLYRPGSGSGLGAGGFRPAYGASQAGAVVRFALAPGSVRAPQAYLRASRAIGRVGQGEAGAGVSLRPFGAVPLRLLAEARAQNDARRLRLRPAALAVTELPPIALPLEGEAEIYAQAGYIAGRGATPFFDAQATIERPLATFGAARLHAGGGAWAGGQKGAQRLDLGPRIELRLPLAGTGSRLAFDWRFRVAGNAAPASGPAMTFSAGF